MALSEQCLTRWKQLADSGDPDAQIVMAWEYIKGEAVPKDFGRAVALFRAAEPSRGRLARFNLAKALIRNGDASYSSVIQQDCDSGFGPALYLMGAVAQQGRFGTRDTEKAVQYFSIAARDNHLPSEFYAWRLASKSIWRWITTFPYGFRLSLRTLALYFKDPYDLRVLM
jgi:TPR repeat protein